MEYIDWMQLEAIRLFPPALALIDRVAIEDLFVANIPIKKNTIVNYFVTTDLYN